jgi:hypothetical protein
LIAVRKPGAANWLRGLIFNIWMGGSALVVGAVCLPVLLVAPHLAPEESVLWQRIASQPGSGVFMPALGVSVTQPGLVGLVGAWIAGIADCTE